MLVFSAAKLFFNGYQKYLPMVDYTLYVVVKEWSDESELKHLTDLCNSLNAKIVRMDLIRGGILEFQK